MAAEERQCRAALEINSPTSTLSLHRLESAPTRCRSDASRLFLRQGCRRAGWGRPKLAATLLELVYWHDGRAEAPRSPLHDRCHAAAARRAQLSDRWLLTVRSRSPHRAQLQASPASGEQRPNAVGTSAGALAVRSRVIRCCTAIQCGASAGQQPAPRRLGAAVAALPCRPACCRDTWQPICAPSAARHSPLCSARPPAAALPAECPSPCPVQLC